MTDWYVSSAANLALTQFVISHTYSIGDIVRRITPTANANGAWRCTTAGTAAGSEPTWPTANNGTVTSGGAVFTNVTGQSGFGWSAPAGDLGTVTAVGTWTTRVVPGDTVYLSSDHSESATTVSLMGSIAGSFSEVRLISVNRAGSTPPVAADILSGATFTSTSSTLTLNGIVPLYWSGCTFSSTGSMQFNSNFAKASYLKNCALVISGASTSGRIGSNNPARVTWDNTTVQFANASQGISASGSYYFDLTWINTPSAIVSGTLPTSLFSPSTGSGSISGGLMVTARGVDFSALGSGKNLVINSTAGTKALFDSCKIDPAVTRFGVGSIAAQIDDVELVNCFDGTNIINERYTASGTLTTERTITLNGGAADDIGSFSHNLTSTANSSTYTLPFYSFWLDVENTVIGTSKTATVQIISSATLTNTDIYLQLEYQGTLGTSVASFGSSAPTTILTPSGNVTSSSVTWNSSPATPQKQQMQITFTPRVAGRVRGIIALGKPSTTVYINPQIAVT